MLPSVFICVCACTNVEASSPIAHTAHVQRYSVFICVCACSVTYYISVFICVCACSVTHYITAHGQYERLVNLLLHLYVYVMHTRPYVKACLYAPITRRFRSINDVPFCTYMDDAHIYACLYAQITRCFGRLND